jgi:hypothetical protein
MIDFLKQKAKLIIRFFVVNLSIFSKRFVAPVGFEKYNKKQIVHLPLQFKRIVPNYLGSLHYKFYLNANGLQTDSEQTFIQTLHDVRIFSSSGFVISNLNKVVSEVNTKDFRSGYLLNNYFFRKVVKVKGRSLIIAAKDASSNYFHWMTDALPKIAITEKAGYKLGKLDTFIVSNDLLSFQQQTLSQLGIIKERTISLSTHSLVHCEELIMPSATCLSGNVSPWIIDYLRFAFKDWMETDHRLPSKIFIGRKNAGKRLLLNEEEVVLALQKINFKSIYLEDLSVKDQIKLFFNAHEIVGVHGAGLTNLLFSQAGSLVLELFPVNYVNQCYWTIASHNHLEYGYLLGEGVDITDDNNHLFDSNFSVSIEKLVHLLEGLKTCSAKHD